MASVNPGGIPSEELRRLRYFYVVGKWGQVVIAVIFNPCILGNGTKAVQEHLKDIKIYNKKDKKFEPVGNAYRKWFNRLELDKIDNNDPPESFDITLQYKICLRFWDNKVKEPSDTLKTLVKAIKDERNYVSHEDFKFTQNELEAKLQEFHQTLTDALDEAAKLYQSHKADFTKTKSKIGEDIKNIQQKIRENLDPLNPDDYKKLKEELKSFRDQLRKDILERSRSDLICLYKRLCKIMPLDGLPQYEATGPSEIMVSLGMDTDKEFHSTAFGNQPTILDQREILTAKKLDGDDPDVVIISGEAGAGKTTLLSYILEKWDDKTTDDFDELSSYDILIRTEFRSNDVDNFDDYLYKYLQHVVADYDLQIVKSFILRSRCLIVSDGFDECNPKSKKLFKEILNLDFSAVKILVTTRPVHTKDLTKIINDSRRPRINLILLGMTKKSQLSLITNMTKYLMPHDDNRRKILVDEITKVFQSMHPELKDLMKNPLYLNLFVLLLSKCPELKTSAITTTKLFIELMKDKSRRLVEKLKITDKDKVLEFEKFYNKQSLKSHLRKRYELTEVEIEQFRKQCDKVTLPFDGVMSTYFSTKHAIKSLEIETVYCFTHRTQQEFGAANALCDRILGIHKTNSSDPICRDVKKCKNTISFILKDIKNEMKEDESEGESSNDDGDIDNKDIQKILAFVSGILYNRDKKLLGVVAKDILQLIYEKRIHDLDLNPYLDHMSETEKSKSFSNEVITILKAETKKGWVIQDNTNASLILELLCDVKPRKILIELNDDPDDHLDLIPVIQACDGKNVELNLILSSHFKGQMNGTSDLWFRKGKKVLVLFIGTLSRNIIQDSLHEAHRIKQLWLQLHDIDSIEALSRHLPSLKALDSLWLSFQFEELIHPQQTLTPLEFRKVLVIQVNHQFLGDAKSKPLASMVNALWPQDKRSGFDRIMITNTHFTREGVKEFLLSFKVKDLFLLGIQQTINISEQDKIELKTLGVRRCSLSDLLIL